MTYEITQIKRWLIDRFGIRYEEFRYPYRDIRILDPIPDGTYRIPLGASLTPYDVTIRAGRFFIPDLASSPETE